MHPRRRRLELESGRVPVAVKFFQYYRSIQFGLSSDARRRHLSKDSWSSCCSCTMRRDFGLLGATQERWVQ